MSDRTRETTVGGQALIGNQLILERGDPGGGRMPVDGFIDLIETEHMTAEAAAWRELAEWAAQRRRLIDAARRLRAQAAEMVPFVAAVPAQAAADAARWMAALGSPIPGDQTYVSYEWGEAVR